MSIHVRVRKDGSRVFTVRWRDGGSNASRTFDRHADAQAFEAERRRGSQLGPLPVQQLTERHGPTLGRGLPTAGLPSTG